MPTSQHPARATGMYRQVGLQWREQLKTHWRWLASLEVPLVGVSILLILWPAGPRLLWAFWSGLLVGIGISMAIGLLVITSYPTTVGWWAETQTSNLLTAAHSTWRIVDDIEFEHRNVDHVAITSTGLIAIETKYRGPSRGRFDGQQHQRDLDQAERSARSIRALLRSKGMDPEINVSAALVIWGPGAPTVTDGWRREGSVDVVQGNAPGEWSAQYASGILSPQTRESLQQVLLDFRQARDAYGRRGPATIAR